MLVACGCLTGYRAQETNAFLRTIEAALETKLQRQDSSDEVVVYSDNSRGRVSGRIDFYLYRALSRLPGPQHDVDNVALWVKDYRQTISG